MKFLRLILLVTVAAAALSFALWGHLLLTAPPAFQPSSYPLNPLPRVNGTDLPVTRFLTSRLPDGLSLAGPFETTVRGLIERAPRGRADFRWNALRAAGVTPQTPVRADVGGQLFPNALDSLLERASPPGVSLRFAVDGNQFIISTADDLFTAGTLWDFDVSSLLDRSYVDPGYNPVPLATRVTESVRPGTWIDAGQVIRVAPSGYNPRDEWPDVGTGQGFIRCAPGHLYVSHDPAAIGAIPAFLREVAVRRNRLVFVDEMLWIIGAALLTALSVRLGLLARRRYPRLAALLLAHTVASVILVFRYSLPFELYHPSRADRTDLLMRIFAPISVPIHLARSSDLPASDFVMVWSIYLIPLVAVYAVCLRRFLAARRRRAAGLCHACGYDLRATPDRCPECGTPVVSPPAPASA